MDERSRRFADLFRGSPRGHGTYTVDAGGTPGAKVEGRRWTVHEPATDALFERHIAGTYGLGAVPLLLDPPGHTLWGAIDVDVYAGFDVAAWARMVAGRGLPLLVCRSKSGGAHNYVFFSEPASVELVRARLREWANVLGYPDAEVFPKQDRLSDDESAGDSYWGNWINLPYQAGSRSTRYALGPDGTAYTVDGFLDAADSLKLTAAQLEDFELPKTVSLPPDDELAEAPPCLVAMARSGVVSGGRNEALFTAAIYWRQADPEHLRERVDTFNRTSLSPPLTPGDVQQVVRSVGKKDYGYRCKQAPMCGLCDREACEERRFGVLRGRDGGGSGWGLDLGLLRKITTDPVVWRWLINGVTVDFTTEQFTTQRLFLSRLLDKVHARPRPMKPRAWEKFVDAAFETARIEEPPSDATRVGQLLFHLGQFCTGKAQAKNLDELHLHKPYTDPDSGRACFVVADLLSYLAQQRFVGANETWVLAQLVDRGLQPHAVVLKGKPLAYWSLPPIARQTEEFDAPRPTDDEIPF